MKQYNSIPHFKHGLFGENIYAFDKIDGSNMRFSYSPNKGWYKFGTKGVLIDKNTHLFGEGIDIFVNKYGKDLESIFQKKYQNIGEIVVFGEFFGENSFAGQHQENDIKDIIIFDISLYKRGIIPPKEFLDNFGHLHVPELIYSGKYDMNLVNNVRNNVYNLSEGVVCKGSIKNKNNKE